MSQQKQDSDEAKYLAYRGACERAGILHLTRGEWHRNGQPSFAEWERQVNYKPSRFPRRKHIIH